MANDVPSELPQHYGGRLSHGELVHYPGITDIPSPAPAHTAYTRGPYSPEAAPLGLNLASKYTSESQTREGLRRRPSGGIGVRRHSQGELEPRISQQEMDTLRPLRSRDDAFYREENYAPHPDSFGRSRPPRAYRNADVWERLPGSSKPNWEEIRNDHDLERGNMGYSTEGLRPSADDTSSEEYKYGHGDHSRTHLNFKNLTPAERAEVLRLPWTQWMNSNFKNHFVATLGEFVGTTMFLFFAFAGTEVATSRAKNPALSNLVTSTSDGFDPAVYIYISVSFGFSLMVNVWIFFRISGGLFNPAVTLGMVMVGAIPVIRAIFLFAAQIAGGIAASAMVLGLFPVALDVTTSLADGTSLVQGVFIEAILTAELVFTIFMLAKEKHKATFIAPVGIGLALFIAEMVGVYYTGGSLNPARSLGPAVVTLTFAEEHWIYWIGPMIGTFIAVFFYKFIKMLEYEMANPGQDGDDKNNPTINEKKRQSILERRAQRTARPGSRDE